MDDDGTAYGAEEAELQAALEKELEEVENENDTETDKAAPDGDHEMTAEPVKARGDEEDDASDAGSEDLEEESSESEDDEDEEEGGDAEDAEMADGDEKPAAAADTNGAQKSTEPQPGVAVY